MKKIIIEIRGDIGSGKTTLALLLKKHLEEIGYGKVKLNDNITLNEIDLSKKGEKIFNNLVKKINNLIIEEREIEIKTIQDNI